MKVSKNLFAVIAVILIVIAIVGPLDQRAHTFIKGATEKTMKFHSLISDVKMVLAGLSNINIPFISGHTDELGASLAKAKDYLLKISAIVFSQLMLLSISQTWIFKILLLLLFTLYMLKKSSLLSAKFLVMMLAVNPGLSIYSSGVEFISQKSSIDFGQAYLIKLEAQVNSIKNEKSQLMEQHEQQRAQIRNGEKHVNIFGKLKEDVSYDFKKVGDDVKGGIAHIRLLIHEAGHEMTMKVYNFCTMIVFSFLLLPLGYALIVYVLFKNTFHSVSVIINDGKELLKDGEEDVKDLPITTRISNAFKAAWHELSAIPKELVTDIEQKAENVDDDVHNKIADIRKDFQNEIQHLHNIVQSKVSNVENDIEGHVEHINQTISGDAHDAREDVENKVTYLDDKVKNKINVAKTDVKEDVHHTENDVKSTVTNITDKAHNDINEAKTGVTEDVHHVESNVINTTTRLDDEARNDVSEAKTNISDKAHHLVSKVKKDVNQTSNFVIDDANELNEVVQQAKENVSQYVNHDISDTEEHIKDDANSIQSAVSNDTHDITTTTQGLVSDTEQGIQQASAKVHQEASDIDKTVKNTIHNTETHIVQTKGTLVSDTQHIGNEVVKDANDVKDKLEIDGNKPKNSI